MKIILMMAMTADGIVARDSSHKADWTSKADKKAFIAETKKHGVIIMGETTYRTIGRPLPGRLNLVLTMEPEKRAAESVPGVLEFYRGSPAEVVAHLSGKGYQSAVLGGGPYTNASFLKAGLVDEVLITIEPKLFGNGMTFAKGQDLDVNLVYISSAPLGDNAVQIRYQVAK
ncbi:MAG: dihydrofolate reductase family protein [Patescibacteria group bacterium]|nr:dihydrofolate reductase family protein [Patescibacteria group bacterium]